MPEEDDKVDKHLGNPSNTSEAPCTSEAAVCSNHGQCRVWVPANVLNVYSSVFETEQNFGLKLSLVMNMSANSLGGKQGFSSRLSPTSDWQCGHTERLNLTYKEYGGFILYHFIEISHTSQSMKQIQSMKDGVLFKRMWSPSVVTALSHTMFSSRYRSSIVIYDVDSYQIHLLPK